MHERFADKHCGRLPGAERVQPFGPDMVVWRVRGRMFAAYTGEGAGVSVRLRQNGAQQTCEIDADWAVLPWETPIDVLRLRIDESYALVLRELELNSPA